MDKEPFLVGHETGSRLVMQAEALGSSRLTRSVSHPDAAYASCRALYAGGRGKRAFDIVISLAGLVALAIPLLLVAALVKLSSRGPVLFWSERDDGCGRTFLMPKFRTMRVGAPLQPREQFADAADSLTPTGQILRRLSIDELPQLFTVLTGKMSLVGPRPLLLDDPALAQRKMLLGNARARPGLTGLAQVNGRNFVTPRRKAHYDAFYARNWSWGMDAGILAKTVRVVLSRSGVL